MRFKIVINNLTMKQAQRVFTFCKKHELTEESDIEVLPLE